MPEYVTIPDFIKVGIMATIFIFALNKFAAKLHIIAPTNNA